jgi:hypothetical protein
MSVSSRTRRNPHALRIGLPAALAVAGMLAARPAVAAPNDSALAETLYQTARELMDQGKYAEACPKFAESYRVGPATGTLLNLAACHEAQGKLASAWAEFMNASVAARRDGRPDRVQYADEHARDLLPKLSRLTITAAPGLDTSTVEIALDGTLVGPATLGVAAPLDPGEHVVEATSPGKRSFSATVTLGAVADQQTVTIPELSPAETPAGAPPPVVTAAPAAGSTPAPVPAERPAPIPTSVYVAGGATVALGAATVVTGILYLNKRASYHDYRATAQNENDRGPDYDAAKTLGVTNAVLFGATLVGAGVTAYLYTTRPKTAIVTGSVSASVGMGFSGLVARGEF